MLKRCLLLLALLTPWAAVAYEEPLYEVVEQGEDYEVRRYEPYLVAETRVAKGFDQAGNPAFRRLAGYIFGDNQAHDDPERSVRMSMTVPVTRFSDETDSTVYRFVMERAYQIDTLPVSDAAEVTVKRVEGGTFAVRRYRGSISEARFLTEARQLQSQLDRDGLLRADEPPVSAVYNGPWTPGFMRRNEVLVRLAID